MSAGVELNLSHVLSLVDMFRRESKAITTHTFQPWADIATTIGALEAHRTHRPGTRARHDIEQVLERAPTDLGVGTTGYRSARSEHAQRSAGGEKHPHRRRSVSVGQVTGVSVATR